MELVKPALKGGWQPATATLAALTILTTFTDRGATRGGGVVAVAGGAAFTARAAGAAGAAGSTYATGLAGFAAVVGACIAGRPGAAGAAVAALTTLADLPGRAAVGVTRITTPRWQVAASIPNSRSLSVMRIRRSVRRALAVLSAAALMSNGCARFNDAQSQPFTTNPELRPPPSSTPPPPPPLPPTPFPKACPAPGVMQGCLESTSGLIMGMDSKTALVAERTTGALVDISVSAEPKVKMVIPVDPSGDGGLMDIVLSPTYSQDRLMYAYVSTPTDNRVIRIAEGDIPKDILTGIPKGATGNMGALIFTSPTTLVVMTGDAGNPAQAADPKSLAGKVLRIEQPTTIGQAPPTTALSGIGSGGGMCIDPVDGSLYVVDRTPTADRLQRITKKSEVSTVWTWPDKPGVAGCAAMDGTVLVNLINTKLTVAVRLAPATGAVTGEPDVVRKDTHAHAWALRMSPDGNVWGATVNKTAGDAEKLDDVVFPLFPQGGGFPRNNDDKA